MAFVPCPVKPNILTFLCKMVSQTEWIICFRFIQIIYLALGIFVFHLSLHNDAMLHVRLPIMNTVCACTCMVYQTETTVYLYLRPLLPDSSPLSFSTFGGANKWAILRQWWLTGHCGILVCLFILYTFMTLANLSNTSVSYSSHISILVYMYTYILTVVHHN